MKPRVIVGGPVVHGAARKPPVLSKGVGLTVFGGPDPLRGVRYRCHCVPMGVRVDAPDHRDAALVGEWYGELTTPTGRRQWVALDLDAYLGRCGIRNCARLQAVARVCDARGLREYEGRGHAQNWRGTQFDLELLAKDEREEGLRVIQLQAERDGDALHAVAEFESGLSTATVTVDRRATSRDLRRSRHAFSREPDLTQEQRA